MALISTGLLEAPVISSCSGSSRRLYMLTMISHFDFKKIKDFKVLIVERVGDDSKHRSNGYPIVFISQIDPISGVAIDDGACGLRTTRPSTLSPQLPLFIAAAHSSTFLVYPAYHNGLLQVGRTLVVFEIEAQRSYSSEENPSLVSSEDRK
jgi:hypothetical protein